MIERFLAFCCRWGVHRYQKRVSGSRIYLRCYNCPSVATLNRDGSVRNYRP